MSLINYINSRRDNVPSIGTIMWRDFVMFRVLADCVFNGTVSLEKDISLFGDVQQIADNRINSQQQYLNFTH